MKQKSIRVLSWLFLAITLWSTSGCISIIENIHIAKSGSGSFEYVIDMSELKSMLSMFGGDEASSEDAFGNGELFQDMKSKFDQALGSNKSYMINDMEHWKFGIGSNFDNIGQLNKAMAIIYEQDGDKTPVYFKMKGGKVERFDSYYNADNMKKLLSESEELDKDALGMYGSMLEEFKVTSNITFEDGSISKFSNAESVVSADNKTVTTTIFPFKENFKGSLSNKLKLK